MFELYIISVVVSFISIVLLFKYLNCFVTVGILISVLVFSAIPVFNLVFLIRVAGFALKESGILDKKVF